MDADTLAAALAQVLRETTDGTTRNSGRNHAAKPQKYDSNRSNYESFRRSIILYVSPIAGDKNKVLAALSFLTTGDADQWARDYTDQYGTHIEQGNVPWLEFLSALNKQFKNPREAEEARNALFKLQQGTLSADKFFLKVDELRVTGDLNDPVHHDALIVIHLQRNMNAMLVLSISSAFEAKKRSRIETLDTFRELGIVSPDD